LKAAVREVQPGHEHEFEAAHGLPEALPAGERVLWQGAPDWRALAIDAFHVRGIAIYFGCLVALRAALALADGAGGLEAARGALTLAALFAVALALLAGMAWLSARSAVYTVTNKRVLMRVGIVLTLTFNLPLRRLAGAGLRLRTGGRGDIPLQIAAPDKIAFFHLWPHVRPWQLACPQPMLRSLPDAAAVAAVLQAAWSAETGLSAAARPQPASVQQQEDTSGQPLPA
jgi:hypothetical protein